MNHLTESPEARQDDCKTKSRIKQAGTIRDPQTCYGERDVRIY
ncbi:MAG TPA: hypothetical protein VHM22_12570 [Bradyrhizobium sp.]|nr:hypothetical protein [Bradyrhizobium sp.]